MDSSAAIYDKWTIDDLTSKIRQLEEKVKQIEKKEIDWRLDQIALIKSILDGKVDEDDWKKVNEAKVEIPLKMLAFSEKEMEIPIRNKGGSPIFVYSDMGKNTVYLDKGKTGTLKITKAKDFSCVGGSVNITVLLGATLKADNTFTGNECCLQLPVKLASDVINSHVDYDALGKYVAIDAPGLANTRLVPHSKTRLTDGAVFKNGKCKAHFDRSRWGNTPNVTSQKFAIPYE